MTHGARFDQQTARRVEAVYTTSDVARQRAQVLEALALREGERVLDIGSGPGLLAQEMGRAVGPGGYVLGIDRSEDMIAIARDRCADLAWVEFQAADATALPLAEEGFDVAVATQVYEYVADIAAALVALHRVLPPGGRAAILDTDWSTVVFNTEHPKRMARVLALWDRHLADPHLPRTLAPRLLAAGFAPPRCTVIALVNTVYDTDTYSHGMIDVIADFVARQPEIDEAVVRAWADEQRALGATGDFFFSLNRYLFLTEKPG